MSGSACGKYSHASAAQIADSATNAIQNAGLLVIPLMLTASLIYLFTY